MGASVAATLAANGSRCSSVAETPLSTHSAPVAAAAASSHHFYRGPPTSRRGRSKQRLSASNQERRRQARVDRFFLVGFPLLFLAFNFVYWSAYYAGQNSEALMEYLGGLYDNLTDFGGE